MARFQIAVKKLMALQKLERGKQLHISDCVNVLLMREESPKKMQFRYFGLDPPLKRWLSIAQDDAGVARMLTMKLLRLNTHLHEQDQFLNSLKQNAARKRMGVYHTHIDKDTIE